MRFCKFAYKNRTHCGDVLSFPMWACVSACLSVNLNQTNIEAKLTNFVDIA